MSCEHDWEMTNAEMTGWWMAGDKPQFHGIYRAVCTNCGEKHEGEWDGESPELPFEGE